MPRSLIRTGLVAALVGLALFAGRPAEAHDSRRGDSAYAYGYSQHHPTQPPRQGKHKGWHRGHSHDGDGLRHRGLRKKHALWHQKHPNTKAKKHRRWHRKYGFGDHRHGNRFTRYGYSDGRYGYRGNHDDYRDPWHRRWDRDNRDDRRHSHDRYRSSRYDQRNTHDHNRSSRYDQRFRHYPYLPQADR